MAAAGRGGSVGRWYRLPNRTSCTEMAAALATAAATGGGEGGERPAGAVADHLPNQPYPLVNDGSCRCNVGSERRARVEVRSRQGWSPVRLTNVPAAKRWYQPWQRQRRRVSGEGGERSTTVLLSAVATVGRCGGRGRRYQLPNRTRVKEMAAAVATTAADGERGGR